MTESLPFELALESLSRLWHRHGANKRDTDEWLTRPDHIDADASERHRMKYDSPSTYEADEDFDSGESFSDIDHDSGHLHIECKILRDFCRLERRLRSGYNV